MIRNTQPQTGAQTILSRIIIITSMAAPIMRRCAWVQLSKLIIAITASLTPNRRHTPATTMVHIQVAIIHPNRAMITEDHMPATGPIM